MNIRLAEPDDLELLVKLRLAFFKEFYEEVREGPEMVQALREYYLNHLGRDFFAVLAEEDGRPAGTVFMTLAKRPPNPSLPDGCGGEIFNVLTFPEYRRQGLALKMLGMLIEKARELGLSRLDLSANPGGRRVYEKLGFREPEKLSRLSLSLK